MIKKPVIPCAYVSTKTYQKEWQVVSVTERQPSSGSPYYQFFVMHVGGAPEECVIWCDMNNLKVVPGPQSLIAEIQNFNNGDIPGMVY